MINSKDVKTVLTPLVVVQKYLGQPIKRINETLWYKSPFRNERTPSFIVSNEKGIHDFGSSEHYDIFSFIQKLYNLTFMDSLNFLIKDFQLNDSNTTITEDEIKSIKEEQKRKKQYQEHIKKWYNETFITLCNNQEKIDTLKRKFSLSEQVYKIDTKNNLYLELFMDVKTFEEKEELYINERKEVEGIGCTIKRLSN